MVVTMTFPCASVFMTISLMNPEILVPDEARSKSTLHGMNRSDSFLLELGHLDPIIEQINSAGIFVNVILRVVLY